MRATVLSGNIVPAIDMLFHLFNYRHKFLVGKVRLLGFLTFKRILREVFVFDKVLQFFQSVGFGLAIYLVMENVEFVLKVIYSNDVAVDMVLHHRDLARVSAVSFSLMVSKCSTASWVK
jgi:hypothetical protein